MYTNTFLYMSTFSWFFFFNFSFMLFQMSAEQCQIVIVLHMWKQLGIPGGKRRLAYGGSK